MNAKALPCVSFLLFCVGVWSQLHAQNLVMHLPLNGDVNDRTSNEFHGELHGPSLAIDRFGHDNRAYQFDGVDDHISLGNLDLFNEDMLTISVWVYPESWSQEQGVNNMIFSKGESLYFGNMGGTLQFFIDVPSRGKIRFNIGAVEQVIKSQRWNHLVLKRINSTFSIYVNGRPIRSISWRTGTQVRTNDVPALIGTKEGSNMAFHGIIDDIRIYTDYFSFTNAIDIHRETKAGDIDPPPPPASCTDGILNQNEVEADCGGPCPPCEVEEPVPSCSDGIHNQNETDVDCGGPCPPCDGDISSTSIWVEDNNVANYSGKVRIGNVSAPGNYKLYVEDGILTEQLRIALKDETDWADYVFDPSYDLVSLSDLKQFINKHRHLPQFPSAASLVSSGIDVKDIIKRQQATIEEFFLHIIGLEERISRLELSKQK